MSALDVLRTSLHALYTYTSDDANPPGQGRSQTHAEGRAALADLEALVEAAQGHVSEHVHNSWTPGHCACRLCAALARVLGDKP